MNLLLFPVPAEIFAYTWDTGFEIDTIPVITNFALEAIVLFLLFVVAVVCAYFVGKKQNPKILLGMKILFGVMTVLFVFYLALCLSANICARSKMRKLTESRKHNLIPCSISKTIPESKPSEDAAPYLFAAADIIRRNKDYLAFKQATDYGKKPFTLLEAEKMMTSEELKNAYGIFKIGIQKEMCDFESRHNYDMGFDPLPPCRDDSHLLDLAEFLSLQVKVESMKGNVDKACDMAIESFALTSLLSTDFILMGQFTRMSCFSIAMKGFNELLEKHGIGQQQATKAMACLEKIDFDTPCKRTITLYGLLFNYEMSNKLRTGGSMTALCDLEQIPTLKENKFAKISFLDRLWPFYGLENFRIMKTLAELEMLEGQPYWAVKNRVQSIAEEKNRPWYSIVQLSCFQSFRDMFLGAAQCESEKQETILRLALWAHKDKHGTFPKSLSELAPSVIKEIPVDPITGAPFKYESDGETFKLFPPPSEDEEKKSRKL